MSSKNSNSIHPLLIQKSQAHKDENPHVTKARYQFVAYSIYNIIRYLIIAATILLANKINVEESNDIIKYCCSCWFVSLEPHKYDTELFANVRFDLSYCVPACVDCTYCKTSYTNATQAYNQIGTCPMHNYRPPHSKINPNWNKKTGCGSNISITSMKYMLKSYIGYSWASCIACAIYIIVLIAIIVVERKWMPNLYNELLKWIYIYNIFLSEVCLYALFKPFQYWTDEIHIGEDKTIKCQVDAITEKMELVFEYIIIGAVAFVVIHLIIITINCISGGCLCCSQDDTIPDDASMVTVKHVELVDCCKCSIICDFIQKIYWFISWFIIFPFMALSAACIFYAISQMMYSGLKSDYLIWYHVIIIAVAIISATLSTFDLFVWFCCCYNNALDLKVKHLCLCKCEREC
eukprot:158232_1